MSDHLPRYTYEKLAGNQSLQRLGIPRERYDALGNVVVQSAFQMWAAEGVIPFILPPAPDEHFTEETLRSVDVVQIVLAIPESDQPE